MVTDLRGILGAFFHYLWKIMTANGLGAGKHMASGISMERGKAGRNRRSQSI